MEALFELIGNPFVIFVLIGILSSLFNKAKGNGQDNQQRRRPARPVHRPAKMEVPAEAKPEPLRESRPVQSRTPQPRQVKEVKEAAQLSDIQKVYQEKLQQLEKIDSKPRAERGRLSSEGTQRSRLSAVKEEPILDFQPDQDSLVQGLIWAEILGQPRAKKPYSPGNRN